MRTPEPIAQQALARCIGKSHQHPEAARLSLLTTRDDEARGEAAAMDALMRHNPSSLPLTGTVLTVKACLDVAGWVTHAGSRVLANSPAALEDAEIVRRLRQRGALLRAQTNMTEFAYGALGLNPWYGTPTTPLITREPCVAGGSSSGGAVATSLGMGDLALGSDTSGSVRIPAAFCGVVGFKPTKGRYPESGLSYLSPSFDVPGMLARNVDLCRRVDHTLTSAAPFFPSAHRSLQGLRVLVPQSWLSGQLDTAVGRAFDDCLLRLADAGILIQGCDLPMLEECGRATSEGGIIAAEAYQLHAARLSNRLQDYDPRVGPRILSGADIKAHAYVGAQKRLRELACDYHAAMSGAMAVMTPTVPMLPPSLERLANDAHYTGDNRRAFQFTEFANRLNLPSISLPVHTPHAEPVGLLLTGKSGQDLALLELAEQVEALLL